MSFQTDELLIFRLKVGVVMAGSVFFGVLGVLGFGVDFLAVAVLVEGGELDHGDDGLDVPAVEGGHEAEGGEQEVVGGDFEGLFHGEEFALVASAIVALALAGDGAHEVGVYALGVAHGVGRALHVLGPLAALFARVDDVDAHVAHFVAGGVNVEARDPYFVGVFQPGEEASDVVLLSGDALELELGVGDEFFAADAGEVVALDFHLVAHGGVVAELGALAGGDEPLFVVASASEHGRPVGCGIVGRAGCGEAEEEGKLPLGGGSASASALVGLEAEACAQVAQGVVGVEQGNALDVLAGEVSACPVGRCRLVYPCDERG